MANKQSKTALAGHTAGIFADMTLDGPEIGTLVAVVDRAKNLPSRKAIGKQDPYCAMRLGKEAKKTETDRRGGQTPRWDQELRFTVHESPDYYRLKCSVFNDDKKTDLIGESWIDLTDLIKPGGGSNDLWHQLNYKGKYAGDVRIELTYYDLRPREEKAAEKKKLREKTTSPNNDSLGSRSAPRQLGPRDVRRRPLPSSPAATSPSQTPQVSTPQAATPPPPPPKIPLTQPGDVIVPHGMSPQIDDQYVSEIYIEEFSAVRPQAQQYRQPFCEEQSPTTNFHEESPWIEAYDDPSTQRYESQPSSGYVTPSHMQQATPGDMQTSRPDSSPEAHYQMVQDRNYRPDNYALPSPPSHVTDLPSQSSRSNTSPVKPTRYRDSPLRQSVNQHDIHNAMVAEPEFYDDLPPAPPTHWETVSQHRQIEYSPSSFRSYEQSMIPYASQTIDVAPRRTSIDARSPLQHIEDNVESYRKTRALSDEPIHRQYAPNHPQEHSPHSHSHESSEEYFNQKRHSSFDPYHDRGFGAPDESYNSGQQYSRNGWETVHQRPTHQDRSDSYDERRISRYTGSMDHPRDSEIRASSQPNVSQPDIVRPQPMHPRKSTTYSDQGLQRKAIGGGPHQPQDGRRLSADPYGPDAYDVLNPASSPVTNAGTIYQSKEQSRESARMREVEKLRDQGPIIGNDGRVIDPSDHLPSDTWAPEPERKTRRPEHVIHFRTKNDSRSHPSPKSHPAPTKNDYAHHQSSRQSHTSSTNSGSQPSNRNRLQKPIAARPLPAQPYARPHVETQPEPIAHRESFVEPLGQQALQRYSYHDSSPGVHRPQLSEYQIPINNGYPTQNSSTKRAYQQTTSRQQMQTGGDYHSRYSGHYNDSLAAEMSTIDIGPSRGGQIVLSGRRGY